jgi:hypothetical protein
MTVGAKTIKGMQCSDEMLQPTFLGQSVTISGGWMTRPLLGHNVMWSERFWVVSF